MKTGSAIYEADWIATAKAKRAARKSPAPWINSTNAEALPATAWTLTCESIAQRMANQCLVHKLIAEIVASTALAHPLTSVSTKTCGRKPPAVLHNYISPRETLHHICVSGASMCIRDFAFQVGGVCNSELMLNQPQEVHLNAGESHRRDCSRGPKSKYPREYQMCIRDFAFQVGGVCNSELMLHQPQEMHLNAGESHRRDWARGPKSKYPREYQPWIL
ncbi:unnamed protein product [Schistocephalus solidus]|uniref:Uncharacterized protein n=1 Tax=Schistocephalus solidus TaxID=70667 RepID=A0A183TIJ0_SCHSO|nr:unnamed protein product [Schistocephalus solidus]